MNRIIVETPSILKVPQELQGLSRNFSGTEVEWTVLINDPDHNLLDQMSDEEYELWIVPVEYPELSEFSQEAIEAAAEAMTTKLKEHPTPAPEYGGTAAAAMYWGVSVEDVAKAALAAALEAERRTHG